MGTYIFMSRNTADVVVDVISVFCESFNILSSLLLRYHVTTIQKHTFRTLLLRLLDKNHKSSEICRHFFFKPTISTMVLPRKKPEFIPQKYPAKVSSFGCVAVNWLKVVKINLTGVLVETKNVQTI